MILKKDITTQFLMSYPAISVYEFDFIKEEQAVIDYLRASSIYMICQRPVLYFDDMCLDHGELQTKIKQRGRSDELKVLLMFDEDNFSITNGAGYWVDIQSYEKKKPTQQPFRNVAGIKLLDSKKNFLMWLSPERLLFEWLHGRLTAQIDGDFHEFIKYSVHYIGQAQNQNIVERLTGHDNLQKVLTREHPFIQEEFSPFELSLIFLKLETCSQTTMLLPAEEVKRLNGKVLSDYEIGCAFMPVSLDDIRESAVNDFEAFLINFFLPKYNRIKYKSYPRIKNGLKAAGYDDIRHEFMLFAKLITDEATYHIKVSPIYRQKS